MEVKQSGHETVWAWNSWFCNSQYSKSSESDTANWAHKKCSCPTSVMHFYLIFSLF